MFGVGLGSKFNPIKASAIVDDEEEEKTNDDGQINSAGIIKAQRVEEHHSNDQFVNNIINEVDEIVQLDGSTPSYMVMNEDENL
jgi:hypothetical protein